MGGALGCGPMGDPRRGAPRAVGALAVVVAVLGACGDGGRRGATVAQARAMLLRIDDLPPGFREGPVPQPDRTTEEATHNMRTCNPDVRPAYSREPEVAAAADAGLRRCGIRVLYRPLSTEEPVLRSLPGEGLGDEAASWRLVLVPRDTGRRQY